MAGTHQSCQNNQWNSPWSCGFWVRACLSLRELRPTLACHYCHTCSPSCLWLNTASWSQQRLPHLVKYSTSLMSSSKISWFLREKQELGPPSVSECGGSVAWRLCLPVYMASWSLIRSCRIFAIPADPPLSLDVTALPEYRCVSYRWAQEAPRRDSHDLKELMAAFLVMKQQSKRSLMRF